MKKLIPALILLLVSAMVLSTSSYAWFSMNRTVSATGMSLTSTAPANLLITNAAGKVGDTFADGVWKSTIAASENYSGLLYPASTADALNFFAIAEGQTVGSNNIGGTVKNGDDKDFLFGDVDVNILPEGDDATVTGFYVEYTLYLKTTGSEDMDVYVSGINISNFSTAEDVYLSAGNKTATDSVAGLYKFNNTTNVFVLQDEGTMGDGGEYFTLTNISLADCVRVAVFTVTRDGTGAITATTLKGVYDLGETNDAVSPISAADADSFTVAAADFTEKAARDAGDTATANKFTSGDADVNAFTVEGTGGTTEKVTELRVVVWIEGQNPKCVNAVAGDGFEIALTFSSISLSE